MALDYIESPLWDYEDILYRWRELGEDGSLASVYVPNQPQFELIQAVGWAPTNTKRIFLVTSANGTGKTTGTINILANVAWPGMNLYDYAKCVDCNGEIHEHGGKVCQIEYEGFFNYPLYERWPAGWPKRVWYIGAKDGIEEILNELRLWFPKGMYEEFAQGKTHTAKIVTDTGWTILFKTIDQGRHAFESGNVGMVIFDEPPKQWQYNAAIMRVRKGGLIIITATPVFEAGWFVDAIEDKMDVDEDKYHQTVNVFMNSIGVVPEYEKYGHGGTWDLGPFGVHPKGNLEPDQVLFEIRNCDVDEAPARIFGEHIHLTGLVHKTYDREDHFTMVPQIQLPEVYNYRMLIDPHDRLPPAVIWVRLDQQGNHYVMREWPSIDDPEYHGALVHNIKDDGGFSIYEFCKKFIEIEEEELNIQPHRVRRLMDPNFGLQKKHGMKRAIFQEYSRQSERVYREKGIYPKDSRFSFYMKVNDDLTLGHKLVKAYLGNVKSRKGPWLKVDPCCKNVDICFRRYKYREYDLKKQEYSALSDVLEEKFKHFMDLVRYDLMWPFTYEALPKYRSRELGVDYDDFTPSERDRQHRIHVTDPFRPNGPLPKRPVGEAG